MDKAQICQNVNNLNTLLVLAKGSRSVITNSTTTSLQNLFKLARPFKSFCCLVSIAGMFIVSDLWAISNSASAPSLCSAQFLNLDNPILAKTKSELESQFQDIFPNLIHLKWLLFEASPLKLSGQDIDLKWKDIEYLRLSVEELKRFRLDQPHNEKQKLFDRFMMASLLHQNNYSTIRQAKFNKIEGVSPGKVRLLKNYFAMIIEINNYLPKDKALLFSTFGNLDLKELLIEEAKELVRLQEDNSAMAFKARTGLTITEALEGIFQSSQPKDLIRQQVSQEISRGNLGFAMARPENSRYWLIHGSDFENMRETKSSNGGEYGESYLFELEEVESLMLNVDQASYQRAGNRIKPKYGFPFLGSLTKDQLDRYSKYAPYGRDVYVFKRQKILNRVTVFFADSFPDDSYKVFYPEKYFSVLIDIDPRLSTQTFDHIYSTYNQRVGRAEIQVWGPLDMSDVESFIFSSTPPDREFYEFLTRQGVKVLDARVGEPKIWKL